MESVVITGMGAVTPIGNDVDTYVKNLREGVLGVNLITHFDTEKFKVKVAAEVKDFDPQQYMEKREAKRMDNFCQYALAAAAQAIAQAGLKEGNFDPWRTGIVVGSGVGGLPIVETECCKMIEKGPSRVSPLYIPQMIANMAAAHISMKFGLKGESFCPVTACATSTHAIGEAMRMIRHGYQDIVVAGGTEAAITPISIAGFQNMKALHTGDDVEAASVPFDKRRSGFVMGEGAGILVLESRKHAEARGAKILCEVAGYGASSDAFHITSPDPEGEGAAQAMRAAMADAGITPADVDYVNAHGTSTPLNEKYETIAVKKAFGDLAKSVTISSTKSMTGHLLGAAGAIEAIACVAAIQEGFIPPTIGYKEYDEDCDLDITPNKAVEKNVDVTMSNSLGFGGHNGTIVLKKVK